MSHGRPDPAGKGPPMRKVQQKCQVVLRISEPLRVAVEQAATAERRTSPSNAAQLATTKP